jgi:hypothetical protein
MQLWQLSSGMQFTRKKLFVRRPGTQVLSNLLHRKLQSQLQSQLHSKLHSQLQSQLRCQQQRRQQRRLLDSLQSSHANIQDCGVARQKLNPWEL